MSIKHLHRVILLLMTMTLLFSEKDHSWSFTHSHVKIVNDDDNSYLVFQESLAGSPEKILREDLVISGQVVRNDMPSVGIEGAEVELIGDDSYSTVSDVAGHFSLEGVTANQIYELSIFVSGFAPYYEQVMAEDYDIDLGIIILFEILYPPHSLTAIPSADEEYVELFWSSPLVVDYLFFNFDHNDGGWLPTANWDPVGDWEWTSEYDVDNWYNSGSFNATPPPNAYSGTGLWGTKINTNHTNSGGFSYLSKTVDLSGFIDTILCFQSWNNSYGSFDYGQVRVDGEIVWGPSWNHQNTEWQEVIIDLSAYDGFSQVEIIFEHYASTTINYAGWYIDDVFIGPEVSYPPFRQKYDNVRNNSGDLDQLSEKDETYFQEQRILENYRIYRFQSDDIDNQFVWDEIAVLNDTTYIELDWGNLQYGFYNYAVKADYTGSVLSPPAVSNWLGKDMITDLTIFINTDTGDSATGANALLRYQNQDPDGNSPLYSQTAVGDDPAIVSFANILKGTYILEIRKQGFADYSISNFAIHDPEIISVTLEEVPFPPLNLSYIARNDLVFLYWQTPNPRSNRALLGYNVFRDDLMINSEPLIDTLFYDLTVENDSTYTYQVTAIYTLTESEPSNSVSVTPGVNQLKKIGEDTLTANTLPLNFFYRCSLTQTIYMSDEINMVGTISELRYYNNFTQDIFDKHIRIWIGETTRTNLATGWISSTEMQLVFDGFIDLPAGQNEIIIPLDDLFYYSGNQNLVIMLKRELDQENYSTFNHFFYTLTPEYPQRSRNLQSQTIDFDPAEPTGGTLTNRVPNTGIYLISDGIGSIGGYVFNEENQSLRGAKVIVNELFVEAFTNIDGYFLFPFISEGVYSLTTTYHGYNESTVENIVVEEYDTTTVNITLDPLLMVTVTGRIVGSDQPDIGLANALITLDGYNYYEAYSGDDGIFTISDVYANYIYTMSVQRSDYSELTQEVVVEDIDLDLGDIVILELTFPPSDVTAVLLSDNTEVHIEWISPESIYSRKKVTQDNSEDEDHFFKMSGQYNIQNHPSGLSNRNSDKELINYIRNEHFKNTSTGKYNRALVGFIIYRLQPGNEQNIDNWSEIGTVSYEYNSYIDVELPYLFDGSYLYAVRSVYSNNLLSEASFSNTIEYQEAIPTITNLQANVDGNDVYLSWEWGSNSKSKRIQTYRTSSQEDRFNNNNRAFLGFKIIRNDLLIAEGITNTFYNDEGLAAGEYSYSVIGEYTNGTTNMLTIEVVVTLDTGEETLNNPLITTLYSNYPNPFNPETVIHYSIDKDDDVIIEVFNIRGQHIITLLDSYQIAGHHQISWNGKDELGRDVGSGIYLYKMKTNSFSSIRKMILMK
ncbi:MAG: carboxypeptidase regulatory-like domain-containing protein [Candidatus Cloacimonetes bacterium]|nr:carboxypeptidase regulatory-like domain-containing protein [Candidatus Cloacimonadota bacterium]